MYNRTTKLRLIEYKVTIFCDFNYNTFKICLVLLSVPENTRFCIFTDSSILYI